MRDGSAVLAVVTRVSATKKEKQTRVGDSNGSYYISFDNSSSPSTLLYEEVSDLQRGSRDTRSPPLGRTHYSESVSAARVALGTRSSRQCGSLPLQTAPSCWPSPPTASTPRTPAQKIHCACTDALRTVTPLPELSTRLRSNHLSPFPPSGSLSLSSISLRTLESRVGGVTTEQQERDRNPSPPSTTITRPLFIIPLILSHADVRPCDRTDDGFRTIVISTLKRQYRQTHGRNETRQRL